jgi:hypothetical protein
MFGYKALFVAALAVAGGTSPLYLALVSLSLDADL